ncbi:hypothetical protein MMC07_008540 [Pseudocyphellaria aurata]|nr:hypothetical protein [Pseudocyphellaria aurata]
MFREPETTAPKSTIKTDSSAPARSAIRRQRTVRYLPHIRDHPHSSRARIHGPSRDAERRSLLEAIRRADSGIRSTRVNDGNILDVEAEADIAHAEASQRRRLESRALLRDALSYERSGRRTRIVPRATFLHDNMASSRSALPDTGRYSDLRSETRHRNMGALVSLPLSDEDQTPASEYMPTPPYTSGGASNGSSPHGPTAPVAIASLTPRFAPAHRFDDTDEILLREFVARRGLDLPRSVDTDELPPLRRMDRRSTVESSRASRAATAENIDGLGDRRRSFSPEEDSWENFVTTITPDERLPSVHSSFTSATASASSLSSNSTSSYGTFVTVPSLSTETLDDSYPTICDNTDSEASGTEEEPYTDLRDVNVEDDRLRELTGDSAPVRQPRTSLGERRISEREEELRQIQANLDRLERQVPLEWWAATGLDRSPHSRAGRERL